MRRPQYSPSRLSVYQTCARQYHFQYIQKVPRRAWANQSFGLSLHRTLQVLHEQGGPGERDLAQAQKDLEATWSSAGYDSPAHEQAELARGKELLAAYYQEWSGVEGTPVLLEKRMSATYRGHMLLGIVDRVDRHLDGSLEIIDYKSGQAPEAVPPQTVQQMGIYHYLVTQHLEQAPSGHSVHYLASNVRRVLAFDETQVEDVLEGAYHTIQRIEGEELYEPNLTPRCAWCDYQSRCPEGRRFLRETAEEA